MWFSWVIFPASERWGSEYKQFGQYLTLRKGKMIADYNFYLVNMHENKPLYLEYDSEAFKLIITLFI